MKLKPASAFRSAFRAPKHLRKKVGAPPGTLVFTGERKVEKTRITVMEYDESTFSEREVENIDDCFPVKEKPTVTWLNICGLHDVTTLEKVGMAFGIHPLILEDILNIDQRPKLEDFEEYLFVVMRIGYHRPDANEFRMEQVSLLVTPNCVITFQESEGDMFESIRKRIRDYKGKMRRMGVDYLAYAIIDSVVDDYFVILDGMGARTETLEESLVAEPTPETLHQIYQLKRDMVVLRRSVWPLREVIAALDRGGSELIREETRIYLKDVYDHTIQVIDTVESLRDMVSGMLDIYLSSVSNKMNEIMKVLTMIATIFIPLSFLAGVYGMNFQDMPELGWEFAYPALLLAMTGIGIVMLVYFKMKRWI
ncbi:MAG: magnesium/cobalt transporter CorA [Methanobacteriota archaeon]|nr:MAG: magnesium/cobalt transporter CorA [Euryarchaeota archaeon]